MINVDLIRAHNDALDFRKVAEDARRRGYVSVSVRGVFMWLHEPCGMTASNPTSPCPRCAARAAAPKQETLL